MVQDVKRGWRDAENSAAQTKEMVTEQENAAQKYRVKVVPRTEW